MDRLIDSVCVQLMETVQKDAVLPQPTDTCHTEIYDIIKSCCHVDPDKRDKPKVIVRNIRSFITQGLPTLYLVAEDSHLMT